ncbi:MAG: sulfatase [Anaerolineales bacterium]|nr:sulfatase [Anaerolineales bacterium]
MPFRPTNQTMKPHLTRRDFLKLASALLALPLLERAPTLQPARPPQAQERPNLIIILFDALAAQNLSLYGYPRQTCPNLERFASRASVYHNHHSAGNFTTPSTASLFTGVYPWTHRAFDLDGLISRQVQPHNLFSLLGEHYFLATFSQNILADMLLSQFSQHLERQLGPDAFSLVGRTFYNHLFPRDRVHGLKSYDQFLFKREEAHGSLLLSIFNDLGTLIGERLQSRKLADVHPYGLPRLANTDLYFLFEQVTQGVMDFLDSLPAPFFAYLHLMPPHEPYMPTRQFLGLFDDGWSPPPIKPHRLAPSVPQERLNQRRQDYDEFIANLDHEFGRLVDHLEQGDLLENSYVIVTSDHGELFERGAHGHSTPLVFEPVIRVPLVISAPGQRQRQDIHALTSNVDLLPSLLRLAGLPLPEWRQGEVLPGLGGSETPGRGVFVVEAKKNAAYAPLSKTTVALLKGPYKLIHYLGYSHYRDEYEFYDLESDPQELSNLYPEHPAAAELKAELDSQLEEANQPYLRQ